MPDHPDHILDLSLSNEARKSKAKEDTVDQRVCHHGQRGIKRGATCEASVDVSVPLKLEPRPVSPPVPDLAHTYMHGYDHE